MDNFKLININDIECRFDKGKRIFSIENEKIIREKLPNLKDVERSKISDYIDGINHVKKLTNKEYNKIVFYFTLFTLIGLPLVIISPQLTFNFFHKKIHVPSVTIDIFDYNIYNINPPLLNRLIFILITLFFIGYLPTLILNKNKFSKRIIYPQYFYNWEKLYKSFLHYGYIPEKFGYPITISNNERNNHFKYYARDGNHRVFLLKHMYPEGKKIKVVVDY